LPSPVQSPRQQADPRSFHWIDRWLPWLFFGAVVGVLFAYSGSAALFEPDEGRNAEKAREILILNDWLTPHENFYPVLDKPIFFYWLIALSYKFFGVSEWAARLPSALSALGCVGLIYYFVRRRWGQWEALWSGLILLGSVEFFILSRVVIFDMSLAFFLTLALCAFYEVAHSDNVNRRRVLCVVLYAALGVATLIKGLVGVVVPGMIIFFYLLSTKGWSILRHIYLIPGTILFAAIAAPWYLQMDAVHPGYLKYYLWDEHFGRFASGDFDRTEPWYYFIFVGLVGFLPWTMALPFVATQYRKKTLDDKTLFLIVWLASPFLFFSASNAKLPHYILPIFPALAILTAVPLVSLYQESRSRVSLALLLAGFVHGLAALYLFVGSFWPAILPSAIRGSIHQMSHFLWAYGAFLILALAFLVYRQQIRPWPSLRQVSLAHGLGTIIFLFFVVRVIVLSAPDRSAKELAKVAAPKMTEATQMVFYDTYMAGMAFYLHTEKPIWMVTHGNKKRTFLGKFYAMTDREEPTTHWGKALLDFEEFQEKWQTAKQPLLIILKEKNLRRLLEQVGESPQRIGAFDEYLVVMKP
jgi:4-amino-4-deoxy-L-arabinose transferase-like glycosyltransferase